MNAYLFLLIVEIIVCVLCAAWLIWSYTDSGKRHLSSPDNE